MTLELEVLAQHLDLVMTGKDDHIADALCHRALAKHPNVQIQSVPRSACSVLVKFRRSRSHDAPGNAESRLAASNNVVSSGEQATRWWGGALFKDPPWANHTTVLRLVIPPLLVVQLLTLV